MFIQAPNPPDKAGFPAGKPNSHGWDLVNQPPRGGQRQRAPKPWLQVGTPKPWLQVGAPKPLPNSRWEPPNPGSRWELPNPSQTPGENSQTPPKLQVGLFWDWSCSVPLLCAPRSAPASLCRDQGQPGGWVCGLDTEASAGIGLPKGDSLSPDLQLCSILLASLLFQIQQFPNALVFGEVGTALSLWLPRCPSAGDTPQSRT